MESISQLERGRPGTARGETAHLVPEILNAPYSDPHDTSDVDRKKAREVEVLSELLFCNDLSPAPDGVQTCWIDATQSPTLCHTPLADSTRSFRLLKLTRNASNQLHLELKTHALDTAPLYRCLSYCWGKDAPSNPICVNSSAFNINDNLLKFFTYHYSEIEGSYIWIDQICMDQANVAEKNDQVRLMGEIYSSAESVIVWLNSDHNEDMSLYEGNDKLIRSLAQNAYWHRVWIVQEVLLAKSCTLYFDQYMIPWEKLTAYAQHTLLHVTVPFRWITEKHFLKEKQVSLFDIIWHWQWSKTSVPHDYLYGAQGLVGEQGRVEIDYNKTPREVIVDAAVAMIRDDHQKGELEDKKEGRDSLLGALRSLASKVDISRESSWGNAATKCFEDAYQTYAEVSEDSKLRWETEFRAAVMNIFASGLY